ncbi:hypothetical protein [Xenorhabdus bharatensis]|uniref:hypothetical protein n=1 Tax=Xenorhabdus bharatensis TaxID=3136256 RepID=UPI0030F478A1
MAIDLLNIPDKANRKRPPQLKKWLYILSVFIGGASIITAFFWPEEKSVKSLAFILFSFVYPFSIWSLIFLIRRLYFDLNQLWSDNWDRKREKLIEHEINRGQKHLYHLNSVIHIPDSFMQGTLSEQLAHSIIEMPKIVDASSGKIIRRKSFWSKAEQTEDLLYERICMLLADNELSFALGDLLKKTNIQVCLDLDANLSSSQYQKIWEKVCKNSHVTLPISYLHGKGVETLDQWIDSYSSHEPLLIISVHLSKSDDDGHGDAAVALLVTSSSSKVISEIGSTRLCRPENSGQNEINYALSQALLWGKSCGEDIQYLWISGMGCDNKAQIAAAPLGEEYPHLTQPENQIDIDGKIGYAGAASPWLAIAISLESAQKNQNPQLIMSAISQDLNKPWFMVVK